MYIYDVKKHNMYYVTHSMYCTLSGTGSRPMESSTPHTTETTQDDVPGPSGEWSVIHCSHQCEYVC